MNWIAGMMMPLRNCAPALAVNSESLRTAKSASASSWCPNTFTSA